MIRKISVEDQRAFDLAQADTIPCNGDSMEAASVGRQVALTVETARGRACYMTTVEDLESITSAIRARQMSGTASPPTPVEPDADEDEARVDDEASAEEAEAQAEAGDLTEAEVEGNTEGDDAGEGKAPAE